jgi:hypothetical protein
MPETDAETIERCLKGERERGKEGGREGGTW